MGLVHYRLNEIPQAVKSFEKAIEIDPTMDEARLNVASIFLDYLHYPRALEEFQAVRKRFPKHYEAMIGEANALYGVGQHQPAIDLYLESLEMRNNNPEAILRVGRIYERDLNKPTDALAYYKRYVALVNPPKTDKVYEAIMILEQAGQMDMNTTDGAGTDESAPADGATDGVEGQPAVPNGAEDAEGAAGTEETAKSAEGDGAEGEEGDGESSAKDADAKDGETAPSKSDTGAEGTESSGEETEGDEKSADEA